MAQFLTRRRIVSEIEDLIKHAGDTLVLVSPFLKLEKDFKELLKYRNDKNKKTIIVYGKHELYHEEINFLNSLQLITIYFHKDLHSKCYVNESKMIITSLNLYEYSMENNKEMGVLIDKSNPVDVELYNDAYEEVDHIIHESEKRKDSSKPLNVNSHNDRGSFDNHIGYCIRTGIKIPFNIEKPLSYDAYNIWNQYGDDNYPEKYCHFSGEHSNGETSFYKPILKKNWKKVQEIMG